MGITDTIPRAFTRGAAIALALSAVGAVNIAINAPSAQAATACYYSNLTSLSVKNVDCALGAYAYKSSASASTATRVGNWVGPGKYSQNLGYVCYAYPTMVRG